MLIPHWNENIFGCIGLKCITKIKFPCFFLLFLMWLWNIENQTWLTLVAGSCVSLALLNSAGLGSYYHLSWKDWGGWMPTHTHAWTTHSRFQHRLKEWAAPGTLSHLLFFLPIPDLPLSHHQPLQNPEIQHQVHGGTSSKVDLWVIGEKDRKRVSQCWVLNQF